MKVILKLTSISGTLLFLLVNDMSAQITNVYFETPLYFEDAAGNKDTLIIGYSGEKETGGLYDPQFDGPIITAPMDSVFEVRGYHADNWNVNEFMTKKVVVSYDHFPFDSCGVSEEVRIIVSCKYPPFTIRYDSTLMGPETCRNNAILTRDWQIFLLQYWWDATFECMGSTSQIQPTMEPVTGLYDNFIVEDINVEGQGQKDLPGIFIVFRPWGACTDSTLLVTQRTMQWEKPEVRVSPNPSSGVIQVSVTSPAEYRETVLQVVDILGKTVASKPVVINAGSNTIPWDLSSLNVGYYWLVFQSEKETAVTARLIIQGD